MKFLIVFSTAMAMLVSFSGKAEKPVVSAEMQEQTPLFSFGIITDVQYCDCEPAGSRFYRNSFQKLEEAFNTFKAENPAFIINLGDLIEKDYSSFLPVLKIMENSGFKIYYTTGNHDFTVESKYKKRIHSLLGLKEEYYSFSYDKFRFIVLNGNEISTYGSGGRATIRQAEEMISKLKAEGEPNYHDWNGGISEKQISWLKSRLNESSAKGEKVFIVCHFPVWPENEHNLFNYREIVDLLGNYNNIIAWFSGHNHAGNYGNSNMVHHYTFKGMVETESSNSYAIVEVYKNKIWIKGYGREKNMILAY
ncbi:MAG TPA: metallophosphoesterase [Bacteroidales bacterium]|nr:metallophosphoesterase [Bacteroidales bacterium]HOK75303.1 metallophosphoesterase [Bacteroidales bacterium]HOM40785.1 metallophosphoesterase [Bacteroidales bacterium]HOU29791.1 metallophosphoesterase [Bacteroidales bacterium]HPP92458.1 metallophosphoesterase [Bacteroidales bacterium]